MRYPRNQIIPKASISTDGNIKKSGENLIKYENEIGSYGGEEILYIEKGRVHCVIKNTQKVVKMCIIV